MLCRVFPVGSIFRRHPAAEKGAALFLILIAIALMAALYFAVTQSDRGNSGSNSKETALIAASQLVQEGIRFQTTANRMMTIGGSTGLKLKFYSTYGVTCTTGVDCFFAPDGGDFRVNSIYIARNAVMPINIGNGVGVPYMYLFAWSDPGNFARGYTGVGQDLVADISIQFYPIKADVCTAVNQLSGLGAVLPIGITGYNTSNPPNSSPAALTLLDIKGRFGVTNAPMAFCYWSGSNYGVFYQIIGAN
jgi:hypothetical protein